MFASGELSVKLTGVGYAPAIGTPVASTQPSPHIVGTLTNHRSPSKKGFLSFTVRCQTPSGDVRASKRCAPLTTAIPISC